MNITNLMRTVRVGIVFAAALAVGIVPGVAAFAPAYARLLQLLLVPH